LDKAPDAFRTISEVADDLDIPQHVLRFWETRFTQIKPMKRSGGRRYYRPDDVDLLRGIRRLLYGEGYTIRGVQRILKENGIKAVQGLVDGAAVPGFAAPGEGVKPRPLAAAPGIDMAPDDEPDNEDDILEDDEPEISAPVVAPVIPRREPAMSAPEPLAPAPHAEAPRVEPAFRAPSAAPPVQARPAPAPLPALPTISAATREARRRDIARLEAVLNDLAACRQLLDQAMKDG
jgi:DNA-binding transcriptional MerR regulator